MNIRKLFIAAPLFMFLTACSGDEGSTPPPSDDGGVIDETPDSGTPDSGTPDSGTPDAGMPDGGTPDSGTINHGPATVQGHGQWNYIDPVEGVATVPRSFAGASLAALIPDAAGTGYTVKPATLAASGEAFTIDNVTAPYLLQFESTYAWFTGNTAGTFTPDLSYPKIQRRDAVVAAVGTQLVLNVTGLAPWQSDLDEVQLAAPYAGLRYFSLDCASNFTAPATGATSLTQTFDWAIDPAATCANDAFLIEASKGDVVYVAQLVGRLASNSQLLVKELKRAYSSSSFTQRSGQTATLNAPLVAPQSTSRSFDMRLTAFRNAVLQSHPTAAVSALDFGLGTLPGWSTLGESTGYPDLAFASAKNLTVGDQTITFEYANPFPAAWGTHLAVRANAQTSFTVPLPSGGDAPVLRVRAGVSISVEVPATQTGAPVIQPLVGPVRALSVNGQPATGAPLTGIGTTPLVSWQPPQVGTPDFYRVSVYELSVSSATGKTVATYVSDFFTESTSLRLPANILVSGKYYYLRVQSWKSSRWSPDKPFLTQFGEGTATALSSRLAP